MSLTTTESPVLTPAAALSQALEQVVTTGAEADEAILARSEAFSAFVSTVAAQQALGLGYDEQASILNAALGDRSIMVPTSKGIWQQRIAGPDAPVFSGPTLNNWAYYGTVADRLGIPVTMVMTSVDVSNGATRSDYDAAIASWDGDTGENGEGALAVLREVKEAGKARKKAKAAAKAGVSVEVHDLRAAAVAALRALDKVRDLMPDGISDEDLAILVKVEDEATALVAIARKRIS